MTNNTIINNNEHEEAIGIIIAIFFFVALLLGILSLQIINRYFKQLSFTALIFVEGLCLGLLNQSFDLGLLSKSINAWVEIDPNFLLFLFLPLLLFGDALFENYHLFKKSFYQAVTLAVPGLLIGTFLTSLVPLYILPIGWDFYLSVTLGAVLSATDPVAVLSLLDDVGASPRLKIIISSESMLNDGVAIALYTIFSNIYLYNQSNGIIGLTYTVASGFGAFFQKLLAGPLIGIAFGIMTYLWLTTLNHRLNGIDTILQVALVLCAAYFSYFVSEELALSSGVLATVFCAIFLAAFIKPILLDQVVMKSVFQFSQFVGNTLIFFLGGIIFGDSLLNSNEIETIDIAWLIVLYIFISLIRVIMLFISYPIIANIGLKTNKKEVAFMSFSGLRGAVSIALALSLDNAVTIYIPDNDIAIKQSKQFFFYVGGFAFLTIIINGTLGGYLLKFLELTNVTTTRKAIIYNIKKQMAFNSQEKYQKLLKDKEFCYADFDVIKNYVSILNTSKSLFNNKCHVKDNKYQHTHKATFYKNIKLGKNAYTRDERKLNQKILKKSNNKKENDDIKSTSSSNYENHHHNIQITEYRHVFLNGIKACYWNQITEGSIDETGFVAYILLQSVDIASDERYVSKKLYDWEIVNSVENSIEKLFNKYTEALWDIMTCNNNPVHNSKLIALHKKEINVYIAMCFIKAHTLVKNEMLEHLRNIENTIIESGNDEIKSDVLQIKLIITKLINESDDEVKLAKKIVEESSEHIKKSVATKIVAAMIIKSNIDFIQELTNEGILNINDSENIIEELEKEQTAIRNIFPDALFNDKDYLLNDDDKKDNNEVSNHSSNILSSPKNTDKSLSSNDENKDNLIKNNDLIDNKPFNNNNIINNISVDSNDYDNENVEFTVRRLSSTIAVGLPILRKE